MSIPGISMGMSLGVVGAGELPDISIPGISVGISPGVVGAGELPDISIPGISMGISPDIVGDGVWVLTATGSWAPPVLAAADDS